MRLERLEIENYKCIKSARIDFTSNMMVLVGPNNCGKTTIMNAVNDTIIYIKNEVSSPSGTFTIPTTTLKGAPKGHGAFDDFTYFLEDHNKPLKTKLKAQFSFEHDEIIDENYNCVSIVIKTTRPKAYSYSFEVLDQNDNSISQWDTVAQPIVDKINSHFSFLQITTSRDAGTFNAILNDIIERLLTSILSDNEEYMSMIKSAHEMESQLVKRLEPNLTKALNKYIPEISNVSFTPTLNDIDFKPISNFNLLKLNDSYESTLDEKGNGVQSLATISLTLASNPYTLVAIDEPETHLHPGAVRELKKKILELSQKSQVILATHSPVLINRSKPSANILVENNTATPAHSMRQIRESLGVELSDNLSNAELVLLVEGDNDEKVLTSYLSQKSDIIKTGLEQGKFAICSTGGTSHMLPLGTFYNQSLCRPIFVLDNDQAGISMAKKIKEGMDCPDESIFMTIVKGKKETELEDCIAKLILTSVLNQNDLDYKKIKNDHLKLKFSEQIKEYRKVQGYLPNEQLINQLKIDISAAAAETPETAFNEKACPWLDRLVKNIEEHLGR